ncbi:Hypothetical predicted protein [Mytilus galloprovincialis]|uniref:Uncharacterized protein n=1 Tax=Mytilus galloprovincialis TaxID=29158 RepID=A0A8B6BJG2_MYTGA|nr:Hypothetical predicted protein [Mytilus galloprovincialis]
MDAKLEMMLSTKDTNMRIIIEKIAEVKSLVTKVKQDTITDDFILEAADAIKYTTSDTLPKLGRELAKCLAVKYGEIPTPEGLARACSHWLELWMKNKTPMDLVYKLRDLEESVIHDEAEKLQKREKIWSGTSSNETTSDTDSDRGFIRIEFSNDDKSKRSVYYQHIVNG